ncbi:hypothetical protein AB0L70_05830 [Kribbella sp. NPDC051952]|uniref:hypothetical protein n=1 Tax=Kribbella sp. NPDC051952 TaxID=3154851 RepID=UPI00342D990B
MTTTTLVDDRPVHTPLTAKALLFGAGSQTAEDALVRAISQHDASRTALRRVRRLSRSAAGMVDREVAAAADGLLEMDLADVLLAAWQKHSKLTEAAERTLADGSEEIVSLTAHSIKSTYSPRVDLVVNGELIHSFKFVLGIVVEVASLDAVVQAGTLTMVQGGECVTTATLTLAGVRLVGARQSISLNLAVHLQSPHPLTAAA